MGSSFKSDKEAQKKWADAEEKRVTSERMELAAKIILAVVDKISNDIIRPGPKPEERECYIMAQELRNHSSELQELVSNILEVEEKN